MYTHKNRHHVFCLARILCSIIRLPFRLWYDIKVMIITMFIIMILQTRIMCFAKLPKAKTRLAALFLSYGRDDWI